MRKFGGKQWALTGLIVLCALFIFVAWWEGPTGPKGKNRYGVLSVSWKAGVGSRPGVLKLNLDRAPRTELQGGVVASVSGVVLLDSTTASQNNASAATRMLPEVLLRARVSSADAGARTLEFLVTPPVGWPAGAREAGWTMGAKQKKERGGGTVALGTLQVEPSGGASPS